jgi:hypothetical protein
MSEPVNIERPNLISVARSRFVLNTVFHLWYAHENTENLTALLQTHTKPYIDGSV